MGKLAVNQALESGYAVAALDVNEENLELLNDHKDLLKLAVDITDFDSVVIAVGKVEAELGPIYRVVNAAVIMPYGLLMEQKNEVVHRIMGINYGGLVNVSQATLPAMIQRGDGEFVSFSSLAGHMPTLFVGAYDASKFAVSAYTEVLYHENRSNGVRIVCVCPPVVDTPLLDQARETVWLNSFKVMPAISAEQVLEKIEKGLRNNQFWIFPSFRARFFYWARRLLPGVVWWLNHRLEGR
jgi:short-subunit dehydrogenase